MNLVNSNLPYVNIHDLELADQGQVVIATYGRGIWTADIPDLVSWVPKESGITLSLEKIQSQKMKKNLKSIFNYLEIYLHIALQK